MQSFLVAVSVMAVTVSTHANHMVKSSQIMLFP